MKDMKEMHRKLDSRITLDFINSTVNSCGLTAHEVGRIVHEGQRAFCCATGDPYHVEWDNVSGTRYNNTMLDVLWMSNNPYLTAKELHVLWMDYRTSLGWSYGEKRSDALKQHPCLLPWNDLDSIERCKISLLRSTLFALLGFEINELGFFPTPKDVAEYLVELGELLPDQNILEPSAGEGVMVEAIKSKHPSVNLDIIELDPGRCFVLLNKGFTPIQQDFLTFVTKKKYDVIFLNPPYRNKEDNALYVDHLRHAYALLKPGGKLIAILPVFDCHVAKVRSLVDDLQKNGISLPLPRLFNQIGKQPPCQIYVWHKT